MKNLLKIKGLVLMLVALSLAACEDMLNINIDPNNPTTVPNSQLLVNAQLNIVNSFGMGPQGLGQSASIFVHQTMARSSDDGYGLTGTDQNVGNPWNSLYTGAFTSLETMIQQGTDAGELQYVGVAKILKAYSYAQMADVWGSIPYSEAIQAPGTPFPKYDDAKDIYPKLFTLIDEGIADIGTAVDGFIATPQADDLIFGGDMDKWRQFAKSLKLRMYNNIRLVQDVSAPVQALIAEGDLMADGDGDFELDYVNQAAPENRNPAYQNDYNSTFGNKNIVTNISVYFYEILADKSTLNPVLSGIADPRIPYYFVNQLGPSNPTAQNPVEYQDGYFLSIHFSSQHPNQGFDQARSLTATGLYFCGGKFDDGSGGAINVGSGTGAAPQRLLNYYDHLYTRAELALQGVSTEDDRALFEEAMQESFAKVNEIAPSGSAPAISAGTITTYVDAVLAKYDAASAAGKLELLMTEKWIANFGNGLQSYNDYRRTGFPVMFDPNNDGDPNTNLSRGYPLTYPWRQVDLQLNPNGPTTQKLVADPTSRVFWDKD